MFGVPLEGPVNIFCDNIAVYKNNSNPESQLKKKHQQVATGIMIVFKESTDTNLADILTNSLPPECKDIASKDMVYKIVC